MSETRRFYLNRQTDVTGVSGIGRVADGVVWPDGTVTIRWRGERPSTVNWNSLDDAISVHGHGGATVFVWDGLSDTFGLTCPSGHHTRNADLLGDPNDEDWRCAHCELRKQPLPPAVVDVELPGDQT